MKRNFYFFIIVLFILSACQPSPGGQGQAATAMQTITATARPTAILPPTATPTPEASYKINGNFPKIDLGEFVNNYEKYARNFPSITFEDFTSGKILENEMKYISTHTIFSSDIFQNSFYLNGLRGVGKPERDGGEFDPLFVDIFTDNTTNKNPEKRPFKILSLYEIKDDVFFNQLGFTPFEHDKDLWSYRGISITNPDVSPIWLVTFAYHNPSGDITLVHTITDIFRFVDWTDVIYSGKLGFPGGQDVLHGFYYDYIKVTMPEERIRNYQNEFITYPIYQDFPDLKPKVEMVKEWVKKGEMPKELQYSLLGLYVNEDAW